MLTFPLCPQAIVQNRAHFCQKSEHDVLTFSLFSLFSYFSNIFVEFYRGAGCRRGRITVRARWPLRKFGGSCFLKSIRFRVDPFPFSRVVFPVKRMCFQSTCVNRSRVAGCRRLRITVRARRPLRKLCPGPVDREKNEVPGARRPRKK